LLRPLLRRRNYGTESSLSSSYLFSCVNIIPKAHHPVHKSQMVDCI